MGRGRRVTDLHIFRSFRCACGAHSFQGDPNRVHMAVERYGYHSPKKCEVDGPGIHVREGTFDDVD